MGSALGGDSTRWRATLPGLCGAELGDQISVLRAMNGVCAYLTEVAAVRAKMARMVEVRMLIVRLRWGRERGGERAGLNGEG